VTANSSQIRAIFNLGVITLAISYIFLRVLRTIAISTSLSEDTVSKVILLYASLVLIIISAFVFKRIIYYVDYTHGLLNKNKIKNKIIAWCITDPLTIVAFVFILRYLPYLYKPTISAYLDGGGAEIFAGSGIRVILGMLATCEAIIIVGPILLLDIFFLLKYVGDCINALRQTQR